MNKKLMEVRDSMIREIKDIMAKYNLTSIDSCDLDAGCSPIVVPDDFDDNNTLVLDSIRITDDGLVFTSSSCAYGDVEHYEHNIPTDALCDIAEFLSDNEDELEELTRDDED